MTKVFNWFKLDEQAYKSLVDYAWMYSYEDYMDSKPATPVSKEQYEMFAKILQLQYAQDMQDFNETVNNAF